MSLEEVKANILMLSVDERRQLLLWLIQLIEDEATSKQDNDTSLLSLRGILKPEGPMLSDEELDELRFQHLMEKHS